MFRDSADLFSFKMAPEIVMFLIDMEDDSKSMTSGTLGEVADLDQLLKDATEVTSTLMARADELQQNAGGPSLSVNELQEEQVCQK